MYEKNLSFTALSHGSGGFWRFFSSVGGSRFFWKPCLGRRRLGIHFSGK
jgi:hypothetical protein